MLSIAKLRVGQEAYQLSGVAQSLDDYYTGAGEAAGVWVGGGSLRLSLDGDVDPDDLRAVLAGLGPGTGGLTPNGTRPRPHPRRVPGFDLTFKAPKSASVLYAVSDDPHVQAAIVEAGEMALRSTLAWLERDAIRVDRGSHNQAWLAAHRDEPGVGPRQQITSGMVAAAFRHRTSRAGDPLLHWHVLVANLAEGVDGRWTALVHPRLYDHVRAAGEVFQAAFRDELSASLGVEWRPGRHVPEVAGIPQGLLDGFSKRSTEIDAWLDATGTPDTPAGRQAAVLATRRHKPEVESGRFDDAWKSEATAAGWGPAAAKRLVTWYAHRDDPDIDPPDVTATRRDTPVGDETWIPALLRRLTATASTFTQAELIQRVAARHHPGASVEDLERLASRVLASVDVVAVARRDEGERVWTGRELVDVEARFLRSVSDRRRVEPVPGAVVDRVVTDRPDLGADQQTAVRHLAGSSVPVAVLVGPAGTGKTYTLDAVRHAYQLAGHPVIGAAPSARAALELTAGAAIPASTLHSLLDHWQRGVDTPSAGSLLIVDEAGMADIRTLEAVITAQVAAGGRALLVGDHHQLPEVGAGGGFAAAVHHAGCVTELHVNRRQHQPWEQDALAQLRDGSVARAVAAYVAHDRVIITDSPHSMIDTAVNRWFAARAAGSHPVLLAGTNTMVDRLNQAVIERLTRHGKLDADPVPFGTGVFRVGERVVLRRNSTERTAAGQPIAVANGHIGHILTATHTGLVVGLDTGVDVVVDHRYLARGGHLSPAYALTTHRAQGGTWDLAIAVGADGLYREGAYVQLSRGASANWIILTDPEAHRLHHEHASELQRHDAGLPPPDPPPADELADRIRRSHAKHLAHTLDPDLDVVDHLARPVPLAHLEQRLVQAIDAERTATDVCGAHPAALADQLTRVEYVARHVAVGASVSPRDRHNVGTVTALDDTTGTVTVTFTAPSGRHATRAFDWADLRLLDADPPTRSLPSAGEHRLTTASAELTRRILNWETTLRRFDVEPGAARRFQHAIERCLERDIHTLTADPPPWLTLLLGPRPADPVGAHTYDDAVRDIARWRARHDLPNHTPALGDRPADPARACAWDALHVQLGTTRTWLTTTDRRHPADLVTATYDELLERRERLDTHFAAAPADWRPTITQLQTGQLTLDDTAQLLDTALDQQEARRQWIIRNWPHIVEYQEINRTLTTGTWRPDPHLHPDANRPAALSHDEDNHEPWRRAELGRLASGQAAGLRLAAAAPLTPPTGADREDPAFTELGAAHPPSDEVSIEF